METTRYVRNPLYVDAVEVTEENFAEVARWCDGEIANKSGEFIERDPDNNVILDPLQQYIRVRVNSPKSIRQTQANVGDYVLYTDRGYKVYTPGAFISSWTEVQRE